MRTAAAGERRLGASALRRASGGIALLAVLATACSGAEDPRPDLLLVTADALRADRLACYGGPADVGTAICALGERGSRYVWALAPASQGGPAAASILTSRMPSDHGLDARPSSFLRSDVQTVAEILHAAGYHTAAFVSSPELLRSRNLEQGFEAYDDRLVRPPDGPPARDADATVAAALAWIDATEEPWVVWIHLGDLHGPYPPPATPDYEAYAARHAERLARIDEAVATLVEHLRDLGSPLELIFAGLHGESIGEGGHWFEHGQSLGLEQIRVPLFWVSPNGSPSVVASAVSSLDIAPTLLRAAGLASPESYEGVALPGPGDPPQAPGLRAVYAEHPDEVAVASGRFYYVRRRRPVAADARIVELTEDGILRPARPADGPGLTARVEGLERRLAERWGTPSAAPEDALEASGNETPSGVPTDDGGDDGADLP